MARISVWRTTTAKCIAKTRKRDSYPSACHKFPFIGFYLRNLIPGTSLHAKEYAAPVTDRSPTRRGRGPNANIRQ